MVAPASARRAQPSAVVGVRWATRITRAWRAGQRPRAPDGADQLVVLAHVRSPRGTRTNGMPIAREPPSLSGLSPIITASSGDPELGAGDPEDLGSGFSTPRS